MACPGRPPSAMPGWWTMPSSRPVRRPRTAAAAGSSRSAKIRREQSVFEHRRRRTEGRSLIRQRNEIERRAEAMLADDRHYRLLRTIPGVGPINALTILAEAGDLRRFAHHRQFLKYCGLDLSTQQSGQFRGQTKLSKFGNARLRRALWMAGQIAIRQRDNSFRSKFERYIARGERRRNDRPRNRPDFSGRGGVKSRQWQSLDHESDLGAEGCTAWSCIRRSAWRCCGTG